MKDLQTMGTEIAIDKKPAKFYVMLGPEYGIKQFYMELLSQIYLGKVVEADSCQSILDLMNKKHLIPLQPTLYIVRYDADFVSHLSNTTARELAKTSIVGTIVCLYEDEKVQAKFEKYLPNDSIYIPYLSKEHCINHLSKTYKKIPIAAVRIAANISSSYGQALQICKALSAIPTEVVKNVDGITLEKTFGYSSESTHDQIKLSIAAKNAPNLLILLMSYNGDYGDVIYDFLSTMTELDKLKSLKYGDSPLRKYVSKWSESDIYYMFCHSYSALQCIRSISPDPELPVYILVSLLGFSSIPSTDILNIAGGE